MRENTASLVTIRGATQGYTDPGDVFQRNEVTKLVCLVLGGLAVRTFGRRIARGQYRVAKEVEPPSGLLNIVCELRQVQGRNVRYRSVLSDPLASHRRSDGPAPSG